MTAETKTCTDCGETKPAERFYGKPCKKSGNYYRSKRCGACEMERRRSVTSPERAAYINKRRRLYNYGITVEQYDDMCEAQGDRCAICRAHVSEIPYGTLAVDHCHDTGDVRGLLCTPCNSGIGMLRESSETLQAAIDYLESWNETNHEAARAEGSAE